MRRLLMLGAGLLACAAMPAQAQAQSKSQAQAQAAQSKSQSPAQSPTQPPRDLTVVDGALPPTQQLIKATRGDTLRWRLVSNLPGEVHVHAYRVSAALQPGKPVELAFTAHASGRFRVEWHAAGGTASAAGHHAPPLAMLEVQPR